MTTTFTEDLHPRATDGKFTAKDYAEAHGGLDALADQMQARAAATASTSDEAAQSAAVSSTIAVAATIRDHLPHAASFTMIECDQYGCEHLHLGVVRDADGNSVLNEYGELPESEEELNVEADVAYNEARDAWLSKVDEIEEAAFHAIPWAMRGAQMPGVTVGGSEKRGYEATVVIDDVLGMELPETRQTSRGDEAVERYMAQHEPNGEEFETVASDLMLDVLGSLRARGVDTEHFLSLLGGRHADEVAEEGL